jgi:V-type H+-transporting ATPase subunit a
VNDHLYGYFWIPTNEIARLEKALEVLRSTHGGRGDGFVMPRVFHVDNKYYRGISPPSHFDLNDFTRPFQLITETYAVPSYKEVNPSVFACVTFPFLFSVMFGDIAHGLVILSAGIALCMKHYLSKSSIENDFVVSTALSLRYLVLLMGIFSVYCGFIYNDFASIPVWVSSCYVYNTDGQPI